MVAKLHPKPLVGNFVSISEFPQADFNLSDHPNSLVHWSHQRTPRHLYDRISQVPGWVFPSESYLCMWPLLFTNFSIQTSVLHVCSSLNTGQSLLNDWCPMLEKTGKAMRLTKVAHGALDKRLFCLYSPQRQSELSQTAQFRHQRS